MACSAACIKSCLPVRSGLLIFAVGLLFLMPAFAAAMPPGHFLALFPETRDENRFFLSIRADSQESEFPAQADRKPEANSQGDVRHFAEIRKSTATFYHAGVKTGLAYKNRSLLYLTAGCALADIDFSFTDELTPQKREREYTRNISFDADEFPVFGGGIAFRFLRKPALETSHLSAGMDLQYRYLDFDADKGALQYKSRLHEIQLALETSLEKVKWNLFSKIPLEISPYGGAKIIHFIGDETFFDPENTYSEENEDEEIPDPIYYSGDLDPGNHISLFAGASIHITRSLLMTIETRFGDDDGYAASLTSRF